MRPFWGYAGSSPITSISIAAIALTACTQGPADLPDITIASEAIIIWDDTQQNSRVDWPQAKALYPDNPQLIAAMAYGYSSSKKLGITDKDMVIYDMDLTLHERLAARPDGDNVFITSMGGRSNASLDAADVIHSKGQTVSVIGHCFSACVETILPSASAAIAIDKPILGVHGNIQSALSYLNAGGVNPCRAEDDPNTVIDDIEAEVTRANQQLTRTGHKTDFWRKQVAVLGSQTLVKFDTDDGDCGAIQQFSTAYWLPTAAEFETYLGLDIEGPLCNDSRACLENRLALFLDIGEQVIWNGETLTVAIPTSK